MKKYLILLLVPFLIAAAPSRDNSYTTGSLIKAADVTANEDAIFNYLQLGVDTYADASIANADVSASANIQSNKLNLESVSQAVLLNNSGNATVLEINNDGTEYGQHIHQDGNGIALFIDNNGIEDGLYIRQDGVLDPSEFSLFVFSSTTQITDRPLVKFFHNKAGSAGDVLHIQETGTGNAVVIDNDGTGHGLYIHQDIESASNKYPLYVTSTVNQGNTSALGYFFQQGATGTTKGIQIDNSSTGTGQQINQSGILAGGKHGLEVKGTNGYNQTNADSALVKFLQDDADSTEPALEIVNDGTGHGIEADSSILATGLVVTSSIQAAPFQSDPCATMVAGSLFYNQTKNVMCFCDGSDDLEVHDNSACF